MLQSLWTTLDNQGLKNKIAERPGMFLGARGYEGLQAMIIAGINAVIQAAGLPSKACFEVLLEGEEIIFSLLLDEDDDLSNWGKDRNVLSFTNLTVIKNLSTFFRIEVQDKKQYVLREYEKGSLEVVQEKELMISETKIIVSFKPDYRFFGFKSLPYFIYYDYCQQLALLNSGLTIKLKEENQQQNCFVYADGLITYLLKKDDFITRRGKAAYFCATSEQVQIEIAVSRNDLARVADSFANNEQTFLGGAHREGFLDGAILALNAFLEEQNHVVHYDIDKFCSLFDFVVSVKVPVPKYFGVTKQKLRNPEVYRIVKEFTQKNFLAHLKRFPVWYRG